MFTIVKGVISGAVTGIGVALLGYAKSSTVESFDPRKALQTIIIGAVIGGLGGMYGWTYEQAYDYAANAGILTIVEYVKKLVLRRILHE